MNGTMSLRMPAEHGAWGILLAPLVSSAAVAWRPEASGAAQRWALLLCGICALGLFVLRGSLEAAEPEKRGWRAMLSPAHLFLLVISTGAGATLLFGFQRYPLIPLGVLALALYLVQTGISRRHQESKTEKRSLPAELIGVLLLTLTAPAAWIVVRGALDGTGVRIWLLNALFFLGGVLYVKYRVRGVLAHRSFPSLGERVAFAWPVFVYHLLLAVFLVSWTLRDSVSAVVLAAFAPGILRAWGLALQLGERFPIKRLGWTEVAHAVVFAALLILAFHTNN